MKNRLVVSLVTIFQIYVYTFGTSPCWWFQALSCFKRRHDPRGVETNDQVESIFLNLQQYAMINFWEPRLRRRNNIYIQVVETRPYMETIQDE